MGMDINDFCLHNSQSPFNNHVNGLLKKSFLAGCSKMPRVLQVELREIPLRGAPEVLRGESYLMYVATTMDEGNAADGRFFSNLLIVTPGVSHEKECLLCPIPVGCNTPAAGPE